MLVDILADILPQFGRKLKCFPVENHQSDIHLLFFQKGRDLVKGNVEGLLSGEAIGAC